MADLEKGQRVALWASALTVALAVGKAVVGLMAHSVALVADALHSGADVVCVLASWFGLKLAAREPTERFPYGYYKAESLATLGVSALIVYAGVEVLMEGARKLHSPSSLDLPYLAMAAALASAAVSFWIARVERRVGEAIRSQSLLANADESRLDVLSSALVFAALVAAKLGAPRAEGLLAIALAGFILFAGFKNGRIALYSLMDASLDPEMEREAAEVVRQVPGVMAVENLRLRRAGPFCFGEAALQLAPSLDIARGHEIAENVAQALKERFPEIDGFMTHVEPHRGARRRVMIPVNEDAGLDSRVAGHFGRAPFFLFADMDGDEILRWEVKPNAHRGRPVRAGLQVVNHFIDEEKITALATREIGEIGFHALRDHYVELFRAEENQPAREVLADLAAGRLPALPEPTHRSDDKVPGETRPLKERIEDALRRVIDPETGEDVMSMGLITRLTPRADGVVDVTFRPTSAICPLAFQLGADIRDAVAGVEGVQRVNIEVENYARAEELQRVLNA